jgi:putative membrane protein (TIGR04086 family)
MNVRWIGVLTGFIVDSLISFFLFALTRPDFSTAPDLTQLADLLFLCLLVLSTGVGGYVAGRMAQTDRMLNGFLVGVVGILVAQLDLVFADGQPMPHVFVIASAVGCLLGALGGFLSRYPTLDRSHLSGRR